MKELLNYKAVVDTLRMETSVEQRNSKKYDAPSTLSSSSSSALAAANAPSKAAIMAAASAATTSTQMRATLIYLAPFLHPCKNVVVPGTYQQQQQQHQHQTTTSSSTSSSSLVAPTSCSLSSSHLSCTANDADNVGECLNNMTHVARDTTTNSPAINGSGSILRRGRVVTSNRNVGMPFASLTVADRNNSLNNNNNNAINCNSSYTTTTTTTTGTTNPSNTATNVSRSCRHQCSCCRNSLDSMMMMSYEETTSTPSNSSCCHNNNNNNNNNTSNIGSISSHTKKDNSQDNKYLENYEMPALETTTTKQTTPTTTITAAMATDLRIPAKGGLEGNDEVSNGSKDMLSIKETKTDNPSLSLNTKNITTCNTTSAKVVKKQNHHSMKQQQHMMSCNNTFNISSANTNTNTNTNKRSSSTKYLRERERERNRRNIHTITGYNKDLSLDPQKYDETDREWRQKTNESSLPLKEFMQQRTNNCCPCGPLSHGHECNYYCYPHRHHHHQHQHQHHHQQESSVDHLQQQQQQQHHHDGMMCYNNQMANTSLLSRCHCINNNNNSNILNNAKDSPKDNSNNIILAVPSDGHQTLNNNNSNNLILRNSSNKCKRYEMETHDSSNSNNNCISSCSSITTNPPTKTIITIPVICPETKTGIATTSYTTILNKECRCFTTTTTTTIATDTTTLLNKRDIIGSEIKENDAFSQHSLPISLRGTQVTATSSSSASRLIYSNETIEINKEKHEDYIAQADKDTIDNDNKNDDDDNNYCLIRHSNYSIKEECPLALTHSATPSALPIPSSLLASSPSPASSSVGSLAFASGWLSCLVVSLFGCSNQLTKMVTVSKWLFMWLLFIVFSSSAQCWAGRNDVPTNCTFPVRWEGSWFLSGYQQSIHIKGSQFSYRGRCAASDGNKYLIVDEKGCHRCLVIYEKHKNVLQYKESECEGDSMYMHQTNPSAMAMRSVLNQKPIGGNGGDHRGGAHPNLNGHSRLSSSDQYIMRSNDDMNDYFCKGRETLQNLCDQIPGDALLYSLFRESAEPVKCPLKGPFIFTYNRGNGECKSPVSNIESCTEDSRLLLSFQACPDVVGTESTVEELTCLATWKDGNSRYLVGLVSHHHAISNEERYRCFVYERTSALMDMGHFGGPSMSTSKDAEYKLAQSGDATCNGLDSAEVGSRIMSLRKPPVTERCDFPAWFKGPRHWHVLMGNAVYNYHSNDGSIHIIKPNGYMDTRALCEQINKQTATEMMSVVHYTTGCQSGFMCMVFYRRDTHIIEIQTGKPASRLEDACAADHFDINKTPYITLLASNPDPQICPLEGLYTLRGAIGPPYMTTRHKRNHNNKVHGFHNHHHQYESNERGYVHRSFRNSANSNEKNEWHSNTRGLPIRSRRDASSTTTKPTMAAVIPTNDSSTEFTTTTMSSVTVIENINQDNNKDVVQQQILVVGNNTHLGFVQNSNGGDEIGDTSDTRLRSRRNVPECITNYKAQRQLWIGCTEPNVIDVRPMCNDDGDEEYSCHGSWTENGTVFIIARHKGTKHGVCISYRPTEGTNAKLVVGDACYRGTQKPPEHHLEANLSVFGKCGETGSTSATIPILSWMQLLMATLLITFLCQLPIQR